MQKSYKINNLNLFNSSFSRKKQSKASIFYNVDDKKSYEVDISRGYEYSANKLKLFTYGEKKEEYLSDRICWTFTDFSFSSQAHKHEGSLSFYWEVLPLILLFALKSRFNMFFYSLTSNKNSFLHLSIFEW